MCLRTVNFKIMRHKKIYRASIFSIAHYLDFHCSNTSKRRELTDTFMMIWNWKTLWSLWFIQKYFIVERVKNGRKEKFHCQNSGIWSGVFNPDTNWLHPAMLLFWIQSAWCPWESSSIVIYTSFPGKLVNTGENVDWSWICLAGRPDSPIFTSCLPWGHRFYDPNL